MGLCVSADDKMTPAEKARNRKEEENSAALTQSMEKDHKADLRINKLLLLGAGESGKSTLFKQMVTIYKTGFNEKERKAYIPIISNNVLTSIKTLCVQSANFAQVQPESEAAKNYFISEVKVECDDIDAKLGTMVKQLWADPGIQATFQERAKFQLIDSCAYFCDKVDDLVQDNYIPSQQDILRARASTTGIVEDNFVIDGNQFKMFDVGGQRNERKKWIHCFENVTAVLFVAAISCYNQTLFEDESTNRMMESLSLFEEICNSKWFKNTAMILFLNKRDLFAEKIKVHSLRVCFDDYDLEDTYEMGCEFLLEKFHARNRNPGEKKLYTHITCATDTNNIEAVFDSVKDVTIGMALTYAGLV